jgi:hypothetical protein
MKTEERPKLTTERIEKELNVIESHGLSKGKKNGRRYIVSITNIIRPVQGKANYNLRGRLYLLGYRSTYLKKRTRKR